MHGTTYRTTHKSIASRWLLTLALVVAFLLPMGQATPVQAQEVERGYLWSIYWDFEHNFHGLLAIEVGPWEDGELTEVEETSTTRVICYPVGNVLLNAGDAVFDGASYLECDLDLAQTVLDNHGLTIEDVDSYGSILLRADANVEAIGPAPIFTHADAQYGLDFTQTQSVTMQQSLWNNAGPQQAAFPGVTLNTWQTYTFTYSCIALGGPCDATHEVSGQSQTDVTAGSRTRFSTGPATFAIGHNSGDFLTGRLGSLFIDPGNSVH
ncbi:MAG: hypothetical protein WDZ49_06395 [Litorilinea sp.]